MPRTAAAFVCDSPGESGAGTRRSAHAPLRGCGRSPLGDCDGHTRQAISATRRKLPLKTAWMSALVQPRRLRYSPIVSRVSGAIHWIGPHRV